MRHVELICGDEPSAWTAVGFTVGDGELVRVGALAVRCDGRGGGLRGWTLTGDGPSSVDGLQTTWTPEAPAPDPSAHPNGAVALDHVVVFTDDRNRTAAALVEAGGDERRRAGPPQVPVAMAFVRVDSVVVEVAQAGGPTRLWGLVAVVEDLDACVRRLGGLVGAAKDAVQPGRRIATVRPEAGLGAALAFMSPRVRTR